jgi:hypothetical protein
MSPKTAYSILALIFAVATGNAASDKGRSPALWFVAGALLPGAALVVALLFLEERRLFKTCPTASSGGPCDEQGNSSLRAIERRILFMERCAHGQSNHP